jgi:hypothetical protein
MNWRVCDNPKCEHHKDSVMDRDERFVRITLPIRVGTLTFEQKLITRYPYCKGPYHGQVDFFLCDTCHAACEMLK